MTLWSPAHICGCTLVLKDGEPVAFAVRCPWHVNALPGDVAGAGRALMAAREQVLSEVGAEVEPHLELDEGLTQASATYVDFMAGVAVQHVSGLLTKEDFVAAISALNEAR